MQFQTYEYLAAQPTLDSGVPTDSARFLEHVSRRSNRFCGFVVGDPVDIVQCLKLPLVVSAGPCIVPM